MMMKRRGRTITTIAGLGFLGIAATLLLRWHDIVTQIHLSRLHADPGYVMEIIQHPEGTPARKAVLQFVQTDEGRQFLVGFCFRALESWWVRGKWKAFLERANLTSPLEYNKTAVVAQVDDSVRWKFSSQYLSWSGDADIFEQIGVSGRRGLFSVLKSLMGETFTLEEYPQQVCSVVALPELSSRFPNLHAEDGVGLVMEHHHVRLETSQRLVGRWDFYRYASFRGHKGIEAGFKMIRFTDRGRFLLRVYSADRGVTLERGTYELVGDELVLRYDDSQYRELYTFELTESDMLLLQSREGRSVFLRPTDVPGKLAK